MDRLTKHREDGTAFYNHNKERLVYNNDILDRLAAYEDTGLMPEEIESLQAELERVKAERDEAVETLKKNPHCCDCKFGQPEKQRCYELSCVNQSKWQWRGLTTNT